MGWSYPPEVHEFVSKWCTQLRDPDLVEICNECFGTEFTVSKMKTFRSNHGYKNGLGKLSSEEYWERQTRWPAGLLEFVQENAWGVESKDLARMIEDEFGFSMTPTQVKAFRQRHGIKSGLTGWFQKGRAPGNKGRKMEEFVKDPETLERIRSTQFKKGNRPGNEVPVGTIKIRRPDGRGSKKKYKLIKVQMEGGMWDRWKPLHRYVWEQHNGPIPEGMCVVFKDQDSMNCDIDNLILARRQELSTMTKKDLWSHDPDLTETALYTVRLQQAALKRRKRRNDRENADSDMVHTEGEDAGALGDSGGDDIGARPRRGV